MKLKVIIGISLALLFTGMLTLAFDIQPVKSVSATIIFPEDYEKFVVVKASFHTHTTYSDGNYTPSQVVQMYSEAGYNCIAITDHDTIDGYEEARAVGESLNMTIICGEEISCRWSDGTFKHVVALFISEQIDVTYYRQDIVQPYFDAIHNQGGIGFVAHPHWSKSSEEFAESPWYSYRTASYIDGWEANSARASLNETEVNALLDTGYFCVYNHDFHYGTVPSGNFTLLYCHNRTALGIKEALMNQRNVLCNQGRVWGTSEALALCEKYSRAVASFTYTPSEPVVNETIIFDASSSHDFDGHIVTYAWDFGDGKTSTETDPITTHAYLMAGTYNVTLTVTDNDGLNNGTTMPVNIGKSNSMISVLASPTQTVGESAINVSLTPTRSGAPVTIWYRLGGEETWVNLTTVVTNENGEYSYAWMPSEPGTYELKSSWLGDENTLGAESSIITITRLAPPIASFTYSPTIPSVGEETTFNASSSYDVDEDITSYWWYFDDGNISSTIDSTTAHTYLFPGTYNVTLKVVDSWGLNSSYSQSVLAKMPTSVSISVSSPSTHVGFQVNITGSLQGMYRNGLVNKTVVLYYTVSGVGTWTPITSDTTDNLGFYSAMWIPPATGYFEIKAEWAGNTTHLGASNTTTLSSLAYEDQYVFCVESNSTITELAFNTTDWTLSFAATGPDGTKGYVKVTVAKSLAGTPSDIRVLLDGEQLEFSIASIDDSWLLSFTYGHSSHQVAVDLDINIIPEFPIWTSMLLILIILIAASAIYKRR